MLMAKSFIRKFFPGILCLAVVTGSVTASENSKSLKMGFMPMTGSAATLTRFAPLKDYLAEKLGEKVQLQSAGNLKTFVARTARGEYDIVFTAPHLAVQAADSGHYEVVARLNRDLVSLIVVNVDSGITSIAQLPGQKVATPPAHSAISLVGRAYLTSNLSKPPRYRVYPSHDAAYEAVMLGEINAGVVSTEAARRAQKVGIPLQEIASTPPLPGMAVLVSRRLTPAQQKKIQQALVDMDKTAVGKNVLKSLALPGFRAASNQTYEVMRPYSNMVKFK